MIRSLINSHLYHCFHTPQAHFFLWGWGGSFFCRIRDTIFRCFHKGNNYIYLNHWKITDQLTLKTIMWASLTLSPNRSTGSACLQTCTPKLQSPEPELKSHNLVHQIPNILLKKPNHCYHIENNFFNNKKLSNWCKEIWYLCLFYFLDLF